MTNVGRSILAACAALSSTVAARNTWADGTCSFDAVSGVMEVQASGRTILRAEPDGILMDSVACGAATITTVDTIQIIGSGDLRLQMQSRPFAPGRTPETDGASEIEIDVQLTFGTLTFELDGTSDELVLTDTQGDFFGDGDLDDFTFAGFFGFRVLGGGGDDVIDCSALTQRAATLLGGPGDDDLSGGRSMQGQGGNDLLTASSAAQLYGGPGDDVLIGGALNDVFNEDNVANGADQITGGGGVDTVLYNKRSVGVQIALDGISDSGELSGGVPTEGDLIAADVENAEGTTEGDIIIGNDMVNRLTGGLGDDLIDGGGADDRLDGGEGNDDLVGGDGNDVLLGMIGDDFLDGGDGDDDLLGREGDDVLVGGDGDDLLGANFGDDILIGGEGNDQLLGGPGNDTLQGGNGLDIYRGNQGMDFLNAPADGITEDIRCGTDVDTFIAGPEDIIDKGCLP